MWYTLIERIRLPVFRAFESRVVGTGVCLWRRCKLYLPRWIIANTCPLNIVQVPWPRAKDLLAITESSGCYVMWPTIISHSQTFQVDDVARGRLGYDHLETFLYKSHGQLLEGTATSRQKNLIKFSKYYSQTKKDRKCFTFSIFLSSLSHLLVRILELHTLD